MTIKEARLAAGLSQAAMSEKLGISRRNIENWESGTNSCPEWAEVLILAELNRIYVKKNGGSIMKKIRISILYDDCRRAWNEGIHKYFFWNYDDALDAAWDAHYHLSDYEKNLREELYVTEYEVSVPDDYIVTTAEQLDCDLWNSEVESEDFDFCVGYRKEIRTSGGFMFVENEYGERISYDQALNLMDDDLRESLCGEPELNTPTKFFLAYAKLHKEHFGETWELAKPNPVY